MKSILIVVFTLLLLNMGYVNAQTVEQNIRTDKILPGLSEHNVREIIGVPARVEPFITVTNQKDTNTFWVYNNLHTIVFKNHYVEYVERDRNLFLLHVQQWADPKNKQGVKFIYGH